MGNSIRQVLRRFNGTDYDTIHLVTDGSVVEVEAGEVSILNTDQLTLGMNSVYFTAYPDLKWCVDHLDGNYAYLGLYNASGTTKFNGSGTAYSGSTIAAKCTDFLNNTIPNVSSYLENVTVNGVTNKVFIPSYKMFSGTATPAGGDTNDPTFSWPSASTNNRKACVSSWITIANGFLLSSPHDSSTVWLVDYNGNFNYGNPTYSFGFRPEVKVNYKQTIPTTKDLNTVLDDFNNNITPITSGTARLTPGTSALTTGAVYLQYT